MFPVVSFMAPDSVTTTFGAPTSGATWPLANHALFTPLKLDEPMAVQYMGWVNGAAVSGNVDVGIYALDGTRLASSGSTAQSGANTLQSVAVSCLLDPGQYYLAMAMDNTTGTQSRLGTAVNVLRMCGVKSMAAAFPLPSNATYADAVYNFLPAVAAAARSFV